MTTKSAASVPAFDSVENVAAAQRAFHNRARCNVAAAHGRYSAALEAGAAAA
jgi:hypothetical protein